MEGLYNGSSCLEGKKIKTQSKEIRSGLMERMWIFIHNQYINIHTPTDIQKMLLLLTNFPIFKEDIKLFITCAPSAMRLRLVCHQTHAAVDACLWKLIQHKFLPHLVGLPADLKPEYYLLLLRNYFGAKSAHHTCRLSSRFCYVFKHSTKERLVKYLLNIAREFAHTAHGRSCVRTLLNEWKCCLKDEDENCNYKSDAIESTIEAVDSLFTIQLNAKISMGIAPLFICDDQDAEETFDVWKIK